MIAKYHCLSLLLHAHSFLLLFPPPPTSHMHTAQLLSQVREWFQRPVRNWSGVTESSGYGGDLCYLMGLALICK